MLKRSFILLVSCIILVSFLQAQSIKQEKVQTFVANQLREYPLSRLADLYKSSFQDVFGPEHLVEDVQSVMNYLDKELSSMEKQTTSYFELCGLEGNFVRVNLNVIQDSIITKKELADCFIRSSKLINKKISISEWQKEWRERCNIISNMNLGLKDFKEDSLYIENLIQQGRYAWVHSRFYHDVYKPHYRIIHRDIFFREIFPKILQKQKFLN